MDLRNDSGYDAKQWTNLGADAVDAEVIAVVVCLLMALNLGDAVGA